ncbi:MAG: Glycerol-3-phosphate ABC transporter, substrate-binding protein UgpB [uncultured Pseudonocardia sp.]|uniref:Glycerol-3-phosphate ABC transporter, substrate-binding protein UgpB n=1 Tax=uncultured Pseudonocardia sp. TaxID=211455 RepID=A0A6J4QJF0_9PSEU|nr:MAG: Glycerol-3-phosphate ABC transporter, substrate-binding protein UgpB [uncultured Pseudonocardia sp.]
MQDKTVIDVWVADLTFPGYMDRLHRLAEEFGGRHPEYEVRVQGRDFRLLPQQIARAAQDGTPPAVCESYFYITQVARDLVGPTGVPLFQPLEEAIAGRTEILGEPVVIDDIERGVRDYYTYDGVLVSMPSVATSTVLFCNRAILEAAGVTDVPSTWTEVQEACRKVAALPDGPAHAITWSNHGMVFQQALAAQGGELVDARNGRHGRARTVDLASKEMLAWVQWWKGLHREGHYLYTGGIPDWQGTFAAFAAGEVAMRISSSNDNNYMAAAAAENGIDLVVTRFPDNPHSPYEGNGIAGTSLWLTAGLDDVVRDGALAFLQYAHNPENVIEQHRTSSFIPLTRTAFAQLEAQGWFDEHPLHRVATDQLRHLPSSGVADENAAAGAPPLSRGALFGDFAGAQDVMTRAMHDVLVHDADPATRFGEATVEAQALLDAYEADRADGGITSAQSVRVEYFADTAPYSGADLENVVRLSRD